MLTKGIGNLATDYLNRGNKTAYNIGIANSGADGKTMNFWKSIKQWFGLKNKAKH